MYGQTDMQGKCLSWGIRQSDGRVRFCTVPEIARILALPPGMHFTTETEQLDVFYGYSDSDKGPWDVLPTLEPQMCMALLHI